MSAAPFLKASGVTKIFQGKHGTGVRYVDLEIKPKQITAIIGESGSGKSTLLRILYGLLSPQEGEVTFKGERIIGPEEKLIPGHDKMKMVTQDTNDLNPHASIWDNIASLLPNTDLVAKQKLTAQAVKQMNLMHLSEKNVTLLSGGEKQRVAIARALVKKPEVLFLDEPFNQVDTSFREGLQEDIRRVVKEEGLTVVIVSHDPTEVLSMADELVVLRNGELVETGHPVEVYNQPKNFYTAGLLANCNVVSSEQAKLLNIRTNYSKVVIYPQWIKVVNSFTPKKWEVTDTLFKGAFEEVFLTQGDVTLKMLNFELDKYPVGKKLNIQLTRYLVY
ncbi:ABC transporter ATP-binding protein [Mucilaginibacter sp. RS28]|uniref:ABC transporter ATP-binding protein n=1 Tax=Mucilaginibacter straminoryzae TaxID=2932774 RepID=A0A9X1X312_9SPHI|nr:ABC transporter ATP-binding protein [Mucilaginibacter straminoryzae]MCJ8209435.1 ABC transporter ATP-binding protein [Mucilaginibacter straminoryzae]